MRCSTALCTALLGGVALLPGPAWADANLPLRVSIFVLELGKGEEPRIDPKLKSEPEVVKGLSNTKFNRVIVHQELSASLLEAKPVTVQLRLPKKAGVEGPVKLELKLVERGPEMIRLHVKCDSLHALDTQTAHKKGAAFVVLSTDKQVGLAIRPER